MKLGIKVQPRSSKEEIVELGRNSYKVYMHKPAVGGEANLRLIEMLAEHFGTKKSAVRIITGLKSKNKIVEIASLPGPCGP